MDETTILGADGNPFTDKVIKTYKSETDTNASERSVIAAVSTDAIDRDSEVVLPKGIDRKHYSKNPVVLWAHDSKQLPIGKAMWTKVTSDGKRLLAKTKFNHTPMGETIFRLYQSGDLNAFSIGFQVNDYGRPTEKEVLERPELADCNYMLRKTSLLEYSAVPVPANPEALCLEVSKGLSDIEAQIRQAMIDESKTSVSINVPISLKSQDGEQVENQNDEAKILDDVAEEKTVEEKTVEIAAESVVETESVTKTVVEVVVEPVDEKAALLAKIKELPLGDIAALYGIPVEILTPKAVELPEPVVETKSPEVPAENPQIVALTKTVDELTKTLAIVTAKLCPAEPVAPPAPPANIPHRTRKQVEASLKNITDQFTGSILVADAQRAAQDGIDKAMGRI